jgi:hypothetical protein
LPIPDHNGNRRIDYGEWNEAVQQSLLGNDRDNPPGSLSACGPVCPVGITATT